MFSDYIGHYSFTDVISFFLSFVTISIWFITRAWWLSNLMGICLAMAFLKIIQLNRFWPALLLLSLLFIYDIFWVFLSPYVFEKGESVMAVVATQYDFPNKLVMPALWNQNSNCSMLGLGDIVIPGLYLCFLDKFDTQ